MKFKIITTGGEFESNGDKVEVKERFGIKFLEIDEKRRVNIDHIIMIEKI